MPNSLKTTDPEVYEAIRKEGRRQREKVLLIASENFASPAVLAAQGSLMTNKYAEGYPGRRYYGGCQYMDVVESLAIERAKQIFGADHVNVQPHSGAQANMAVYFAVLKPGDAILGMDLAHGGHLTHGSRVSFSGILYRAYSYGVDRTTECIDYDAVRKMAEECRPRLIVVGASAYPRTLDFPKFHEIAQAVAAYLMVDIAHIAGLIAAGLHPSPIPYADFVTTTTHKTLRGPRGGMVMCKAEHAKALDSAVFPGLQGGPLMHVIAAKAVALAEALRPDFKIYARNVVENAKALASTLQAGGTAIVSGGTDTHLMLVDLRPKGITGKAAEAALGRAKITVNKNGVPFDTASPMVTSGIRLGTPAGTTRGFGVAEFKRIGEMIVEVLDGLAKAGQSGQNEAEAAVKARVAELTARFPIY